MAVGNGTVNGGSNGKVILSRIILQWLLVVVQAIIIFFLFKVPVANQERLIDFGQRLSKVERAMDERGEEYKSLRQDIMDIRKRVDDIYKILISNK
ncbi:hypothetical protein DRQ17_00565 [bacterium]|nr:MAG: hypothetical protein DRQ17_00565 [bacterium]